MHETTHVSPGLNACSVEQLDNLHRASLQILETTGVNVHCPELREKLKAAGAVISDDLHARIGRDLVEQALSTAPSCIEVADRHGKVAMTLEGKRTFFGTGSDLKYTIDSETGKWRESGIADVRRSAALCDKLTNIDFVMSYGLPNDVPTAQSEIKQMSAMLEATSKPIVMTLYSGREVFKQVHKLACGGMDDASFKARPTYVMYGQFVSPLEHDTDALERLTLCADHGVPLIYVPTIMMGASGPISLAGALALANAECLAGLVMHQLHVPGAPFVYGGCVSPLDMRTTAFSYGAPEWRLADIVLSQLSQRYDLPIFGTAGATDAKTADAQAGAEWAYSLLTCALAGTNLIHDVGYLGGGMAGSLEALALCNEIIGMVKRMQAGFDLNAETLALDLIEKVGPGSHFTDSDHTLERYLEDVWYPGLFERGRYDHWCETGSRQVERSAKECVHKLLGD